jgi:hypothetical protein
MEEFSGLYKKMWETADRIQHEWEPQQWDNYCEHGDRYDGLAEIVPEEKVSKEKADELRANFVWLPEEYQIRERLFPKFARGAAKLIELIEEQYSEFRDNSIEKIRRQFSEKPDNIMNVLAVLFVMEYCNISYPLGQNLNYSNIHLNAS